MKIHGRKFRFRKKTIYDNEKKEWFEYPGYEKGVGVHLTVKDAKDFGKAFEKELLKDENLIVHYKGFIDGKGEQRSDSIIVKESHPEYKKIIKEIIQDYKNENDRYLYEKENALKFLEVGEERFNKRIKAISVFENIL